jgi:riboflavin kinase, archaea type
MMVRDHSHFNYYHFLVMIHLLSNGGKDSYLEITSTQISSIINRSQQTASKILIDLEKEDLIERVKNKKKFGMKLTEAGFEILQNIYDLLKISMEDTHIKPVLFKGKIVTGMGEGAYYMSLEGYKKQFQHKLGYEPFPGTLNVKIEDKNYVNSRKDLINYPSIYIDGFKNSDRTFGWVRCYPATITQEPKLSREMIESQHPDILNDVHVLLLERTHHNNNLIEVIGPLNLKESSNLKNGDSVVIRIKESVRNTQRS